MRHAFSKSLTALYVLSGGVQLVLCRDLSDHDEHVEVSLAGGRLEPLFGARLPGVLVLLHRCQSTSRRDLHGNNPARRRRACGYLHDNCCHRPSAAKLRQRGLLLKLCETRRCLPACDWLKDHAAV